MQGFLLSDQSYASSLVSWTALDYYIYSDYYVSAPKDYISLKKAYHSESKCTSSGRRGSSARACPGYLSRRTAFRSHRINKASLLCVSSSGRRTCS